MLMVLSPFSAVCPTSRSSLLATHAPALYGARSQHYWAHLQPSTQVTGANSRVQWVANRSLASLQDELPTSSIDWLLVPGGVGTRSLVQDPTFCTQLAAIAQRASLCMSVCTGSALLAAAGCLDGHKATSNKRSWAWASAQGAGRVQWVHQARWVVSHKYWTSSGVAAGMDMALAFITKHAGGMAMLARCGHKPTHPQQEQSRRGCLQTRWNMKGIMTASGIHLQRCTRPMRQHSTQ